MLRVLIFSLLFLSLTSALHLKNLHKLKKTHNYCQHPANLMNWGRGRPLAVSDTKFDQNGVPTRSNVIIDLTTKSYVDFDAWCVSADVFIQSFTNGLCLNVKVGNLIAKSHCEMKWTIFPPDYKTNQWVEFRTELNGKTLALTAHAANDRVSLEEIITDDTDAKMPLQKWNVHYPQ